MLRNDADRHGGVAQLLHWLVAGLIVGMFGLGWYMAGLPLGQHKFAMYQLHKSLGLTVFGLVVLRLAWRLLDPAPPLPTTMPRWERRAAKVGHGLLYGLLLLQPLIGFLQSNAANFPVVLWGVLPLPALLGADEALAERLLELHGLCAQVLLVLVLIHVAAALRHHFVIRDDVLRRMLPRSLTGARTDRPVVEERR
jgi:cytochrome b561